MKITDGDVNVNIKEIKKPELNSNLVAENIAQQLVKSRLQKSYEKINAICNEIKCKRYKSDAKWKIAENEIARTEWLREEVSHLTH